MGAYPLRAVRRVVVCRELGKREGRMGFLGALDQKESLLDFQPLAANEKDKASHIHRVTHEFVESGREMYWVRREKPRLKT